MLFMPMQFILIILPVIIANIWHKPFLKCNGETCTLTGAQIPHFSNTCTAPMIAWTFQMFDAKASECNEYVLDVMVRRILSKRCICSSRTETM